jgi:NADPH-dependent 2,4-dienoyl-CoA reductase/sulfur reductase-like enzyme/rhodanese-related sulfurtransferase
MKKKVIIVGGVAGGASTAARLRRLEEDTEIIMFERDEYISYANCGLPYYLSGVIKERDKLIVQTPQGMKNRFKIDVRVNSEVIGIYPKEKEIEVLERNGRRYRESYDRLVLSTGSAPVKPPFKGLDLVNSFFVRSIADIDKLKEYLDDQKPERVTVIGGGFIGLEVAENLVARDIKTTIVELSNQVMPSLDFEMAVNVHNHLRSQGINLILNNGVEFFESEEHSSQVVLKNGQRFATDFVILALGVKPEAKLAKEAGLEIGKLGGIKVNQRLETSDPAILALGDVIEVKNIVTGLETLIPLAGPANKQGRIAADVIAGRKSSYKGTMGTAIAKIFDIVVASTGVNEKTFKSLGIPYQVSFTHPGSAASYYPGSVAMAIKLLLDPETGKILGAQIVGNNGVDKRIDSIAGALGRGDTVFDLTELELAYAPPFSSAKDPVNMAGYVASNIVNGDVSVIQWHELQNLDLRKTVVVDVRTPKEYLAGHIPGSINIPVDEIRDCLAEFPQDKEIVLYCRVGMRGYFACRILQGHGFKRVKNLSGGWLTYNPAMAELSPDLKVKK